MPKKKVQRHLSKGILAMKFMNKSKEKFEKEKELEESEDLFSNGIIEKMKEEGSNFVMEPSIVVVEDLLSGRMSFKGMNPEIERFMENEKLSREEKQKAEDRIRSNKPEINDEEMADCLGKSIKNRFITKKTKRSIENGDSTIRIIDEINGAKRPKFVKPVDSD